MHHQSICQFAFLSLCWVLIAVRETDGGTFVPGRCLCPQTQQSVRARLKDFAVYPKSPGCNRATVIVTLMGSNRLVCLNPEAPLGKQMIHCWNRSHKLGRDVKQCLKRRRRGRGQRQWPRRKSQGPSRRA
ncbi:C-X-C motif chemokine 9-like isoform X2 [Brachionichthys hirsutus]|uniref:C-X-C motif chemokine 9-like isoform X2 n=1 Tax=Brachionichthys hirsutus TaxID=412623 RepID=UPI0036054205